MSQFSYIDIFAGCGGLSLGLHNAGWKGLFAIEKSKDAFETLKYNLIDTTQHFGWKQRYSQTITEFAMHYNISEKEIPCLFLYDLIGNRYKVISKYRSELKKLAGTVTLVVGGPPCQGFSMAGQRKKNDIRNTLSDSYIEFISIVKPKFLVFENVQGFTIGFKDENEKKGVPYSMILKEKLEKLGYSVEGKMIDISCS
jgi:DNA (cytosine-5)-methyltransferase 1